MSCKILENKRLLNTIDAKKKRCETVIKIFIHIQYIYFVEETVCLLMITTNFFYSRLFK